MSESINLHVSIGETFMNEHIKICRVCKNQIDIEMWGVPGMERDCSDNMFCIKCYPSAIIKYDKANDLDECCREENE